MRTVAKSVVVCALALIVSGAVSASAPASARQMYESAMAREKALRAKWDAEASPAPAAPVNGRPVAQGISPVSQRQARSVITTYEAIVRTHRTSGYCDNALWQAAALAADLFARSQQVADRRSAVRLFEFLAREYPASPLAAKAADQARRLQSPAPVATPVPSARPAAPAAGDSARPEPVEGRTRATPPSLKGPASVPANRGVSTIREIRRSVLAELVRVSIELDREVMFHEERVENPARLLFDLPATRPAPGLQDANWSYQDDVVRHIRVGRHPNQTTRVVLDLDGVSRYTVVTLYNPYRIMIDCERVGGPSVTRPSTFAATRPSAASAETGVSDRANPKAEKSDADDERPVVEAPKKSPPPKPTAGEKADDRSGDKPAERTAEKAAEPPAPAPDRNRFSMARQLGLGVSRIVIDPGHGGHDPGAEGAGISEADIVLDIALRLEKALKKQPGVEVVLTRRTDVFIPLEERTAIANREQADLFLSIHANASRNTNARGIESYYLNFASNPAAEAVAARENAASERTMNSLTDMIKAIALNNKLDESKDFAGLVQEAMARRLRASNKSLRDLGVKKAPFVVLIGASMPSVLAEVSFITNKREGQLLRTDAYKQRIAEALADAILRYKRGLKPTNIVAHGGESQ